MGLPEPLISVLAFKIDLGLLGRECGSIGVFDSMKEALGPSSSTA